MQIDKHDGQSALHKVLFGGLSQVTENFKPDKREARWHPLAAADGLEWVAGSVVNTRSKSSPCKDRALRTNVGFRERRQ